jgi:hypothetical protein
MRPVVFIVFIVLPIEFISFIRDSHDNSSKLGYKLLYVQT